MSFIKTAEQVAGGSLLGNDLIFNPAEVLSILYETKPDIIARILPPPLEPYKKPYVIIAYNYFKTVSFDSGLRGPGYRETALYIPAMFEGTVGTFVAAMTLDTDMGTFLGREKFGYPKKIGIVDHQYDGDEYIAFSARHGIPYATLKAKLDGRPNDPAFEKEMAEVLCSDPDRPGFAINWTFKWSVGINKQLFLHRPMLIKGWKSKTSLGIPARIGSAEVQLVWSDDDPWAELEVVKVLGASLVTVESRMYCDVESIEVDEEAFKPYAFFGWDRKSFF